MAENTFFPFLIGLENLKNFNELLCRLSSNGPNPFGLKKDDQLEQTTALKQGTPGTSEYYVPRKFVPMTRKALIRRIVEDENLINSNDRSYFQNLAVNLDNAIAGTFHGVLGELKVSHRCCHHPQENQKQRYVVINGSLNLGS